MTAVAVDFQVAAADPVHYNSAMDNFTLAVLIGGLVVFLSFAGLLMADMKHARPSTPEDPSNKGGAKRSA